MISPPGSYRNCFQEARLLLNDISKEEMQLEKILLVVFLCCGSILSSAQKLGSIRGTLKSRAGEAIPSLTVRLQATTLGAASDMAGGFSIKNVAPGAYTLLVTGVGYKPVQQPVTVAAGQETVVSLTVLETAVAMAGVIVLGRTEVQEANRQAFNVTAIDATKLYNTTLDIAGALDRVAGVRVRESGGVGSSFNLSLNGFSGNHVRYFIDGIPMEGFGTSFQINNIPINTAERIEVYKGVVPIWLGSDALGGAINIITGDRYRNYVDASYSVGSFNTHRSTVNAAVTSKSGLTFQLNAFQNYSDNDYQVKVDVATFNGVYSPGTWVRRFHDNYHNETLVANVGVVGKRYADKLLLGVTLGKNYQEIQTGARMEGVFGGWHRRGTLLMPSLKYRKENLLPGLDVTLNANYNFGTEQNIDTVGGRYNWYGDFERRIGTGGERERSLYKYRNNNGIATAMVNYRLGEHQALALNNVFNTFDRMGSDPLFPNRVDPARKSQKNILGLAYSYNVKDAWSVSVFGKDYLQRNVMPAAAEQTATNRLGYGIAGTYFVMPSLQVKASYELANRLPEPTELFGDVLNQEANPNLKPERSRNINLGASYTLPLGANDRLLLNANGVYRYSYDFVYNRPNNNQTKLVADNRDGVWTLGTDAEVRYSHKNRFSAGTTLTYQYLRSTQQYERDPATGVQLTGQSPAYLAQMPNIPSLFGNADVSWSLPNVGGKGNNLSLGYNLLYVYRFWLFWPIFGDRNITTADPKRAVVEQLSHDVNVVYSLKNGRYNLGLECGNLANALLYDNFSLQKPGRGFYVNFRYFITKTNN